MKALILINLLDVSTELFENFLSHKQKFFKNWTKDLIYHWTIVHGQLIQLIFSSVIPTIFHR